MLKFKIEDDKVHKKKRQTCDSIQSAGSITTIFQLQSPQQPQMICFQQSHLSVPKTDFTKTAKSVDSLVNVWVALQTESDHSNLTS